jgi:hypothetical protein
MFLLGAGASKDAGLPLATEITRQALQHINDESPQNESALLNYIVSAVIGHNGHAGQRPDELPDIETVVSAVELLIERESLEIVPFVQAWDGAVSQIGVTHPSWRLPHFSWGRYARGDKSIDRGQLQDFGNHIATYVQKQMEEAFTRSNTPVYHRLHARLIQDLCRTLETPNPELLNYLHPLVKHAAEQDLPIATLNYDLTLETAGDNLGIPVDTGVSAWRETGQVAFGKQSLRFLKLHGSLGWTSGRPRPGTLASYLDLTQPDPFQPVPPVEGEEPAVIYGKRGKLRAQGPFLELRHHFTQALESFASLVVIGYSFQDDHVNQAIGAWLRRSDLRRIFVVDPSITDNTIYESGNEFLQALRRLNRPSWADPGTPQQPPRFFAIQQKASDALQWICQPTDVLAQHLIGGHGAE